jgi:hypothetical protein
MLFNPAFGAQSLASESPDVGLFGVITYVCISETLNSRRTYIWVQDSVLRKAFFALLGAFAVEEGGR